MINTQYAFSESGKHFSLRKCQIWIPRMFLPLEESFPKNFFEQIFMWVAHYCVIAPKMVLEKPSMPQAIQATIVNNTVPVKIKVSWKPGFDGNSPLLKHSIEMRTLGPTGILFYCVYRPLGLHSKNIQLIR